MSNAPDLTTFSDKELLEHLLLAESDEQSAKLAKKKITNEILSRKDIEIKSALSEKVEPFGVVNLKIAGKTVKFDIVKKVEWLQKELGDLWKQIEKDGADPHQYINVEYKVSENAFKGWGDNLKAHFSPARIVKAGNITIKIQEDKE